MILAAEEECAICFDDLSDSPSPALPCSHRFCRQCLRNMPDCLTCGQSHFQREEVGDPYSDSLLERLSLLARTQLVAAVSLLLSRETDHVLRSLHCPAV